MNIAFCLHMLSFRMLVSLNKLPSSATVIPLICVRVDLIGQLTTPQPPAAFPPHSVVISRVLLSTNLHLLQPAHEMKGQQLRSKLKKAGKQTGKCLQTAAWQVCKCALWTCCAPCICLAMLCLPRRRRGTCVRHGKLSEYARPPVPFPRHRALTIPSADWQEDQVSLDQPQSAFMTKLPLEIRRMIYEKALGEASIHVTTMGGALRARCCTFAECRCGNMDALQEKNLNFALPLLRTCRQM